MTEINKTDEEAIPDSIAYDKGRHMRRQCYEKIHNPYKMKHLRKSWTRGWEDELQDQLKEAMEK